MAAIALRSEERIGLGLALAAHAGLVAWLALSPPAPAPLPPPERMSVTLSEDVGLTATAPQPAAALAPDEAPVPGEVAPVPQPQPTAVAPPKPQPASPRPVPAPVTKVAPPPPRVAPARVAPARPAPPTTTRPTGASRIGSDFLKGVSGAQGTARTAAPAAAFGPQQQSALRAAIMRQLKPNWSAPQGADAEKLVTQVRFNLNRNGALVGDPQVIAQSGQTPANAAQVRLHAERAIRAVRLAAPFILPPDLYDHWQTVTSTFDRRLSQ
ncbi:MAG: TonB C-terminal domain-containing protein [Novosphingobium sp.]